MSAHQGVRKRESWDKKKEGRAMERRERGDFIWNKKRTTHTGQFLSLNRGRRPIPISYKRTAAV